jgi:hypothetical protein
MGALSKGSVCIFILVPELYLYSGRSGFHAAIGTGLVAWAQSLSIYLKVISEYTLQQQPAPGGTEPRFALRACACWEKTQLK